jgi:hypothetical protein
MTHDPARRTKKPSRTEKLPALLKAGWQVDRELLAYHEAGHAAMAFLMGATVRYVTIVPNDEYAGHVFSDKRPLSALLRAVVCWGGHIGEEMRPGWDGTHPIPFWNSSDVRAMETLVDDFLFDVTRHFWSGSGEVCSDVAGCLYELAKALAYHFARLDAAAFAAAVRAVAERLLRQNTVKGKTLHKLMSVHIQPLFVEGIAEANQRPRRPHAQKGV